MKGQVKTYDPEPQGMVPALIRPGLRHLPFPRVIFMILGWMMGVDVPGPEVMYDPKTNRLPQ